MPPGPWLNRSISKVASAPWLMSYQVSSSGSTYAARDAQYCAITVTPLVPYAPIDSTTLVTPGWAATVDAHGNLLLERIP